MASTSDFLFQNQAPAAFTNSVTERNDMPLWYQSARQQAISRASSIAGAPYTPYQGPRIAGFTDPQQQAFGKATSVANQGNPYASQALADTQQMGTAFDQGTFNQFMNPYSDGLNQRIADLGMQNFNEKLAPAIQDSFIGHGMFGSSNHADTFEKALRDTGDSILGQQNQNLYNGYNSAMSNYGQAMNRVGAAGAQLNQLGESQFNTGLAGAAALEGIGGEQQGQNQKNLDLAYGDFQNQLNYPKDQLNWMNSVINGYQPQASTTANQTSVPNGSSTQPGALGQILSNLQGYGAVGGGLG